MRADETKLSVAGRKVWKQLEPMGSALLLVRALSLPARDRAMLVALLKSDHRAKSKVDSLAEALGQFALAEFPGLAGPSKKTKAKGKRPTVKKTKKSKKTKKG